MTRRMADDSYGLYAHVPFCARRCDYCDFFIVVARDPGAFFEVLAEDLRIAAGEIGSTRPRLDTIYIGGGTPSSVEPRHIASFLDACAALFDVAAGAEITMEANPEGVTPQRAAAWRAAGVNRLSLGVQSLDDAVLAPRGRAYTAAGAIAATRAARAGGFENLSADLIAGLPGETVPGFLEGVARIVAAAPDHVSVYLIETGESGKESALARAVLAGRQTVPDDDALVAMYEGAAALLEDAGLRRYEISNFAVPGRESRHNMRYWLSDPWAGVGPSAHAYIGGRRFARPADLGRWSGWVRSAAREQAPGEYTLPDAEEQAREALVLALRLTGGVDLAAFARRWHFDALDRVGAAIGDLVAEGLLAREQGRLHLTARGLLLSNEVFARFL